MSLEHAAAVSSGEGTCICRGQKLAHICISNGEKAGVISD